MNAPQESSDQEQPSVTVRERLVFAVPAALCYGVLIYLLVWRTGPDEGLPVLSGLIALPAALGSVAAMLADPRGANGAWYSVKVSWLVTCCFLVVAMVAFHEAGICLAMASPIFLSMASLGAGVTQRMLRRYRHRKSISSVFMVLPLVALPVDTLASYPEHAASVTSVIEIAASPEIVWHNTVSIPAIASDELPFTFTRDILGVPQPVDARLEGTGIGAVRHLRWTKGVTFQEIVTDWDTNRHLAWTFRFEPESIPPEIEGHISVESTYLRLMTGDYRLTPLANGKTRLTLTTHYRIATPINAYCDLWGWIFLNDFHNAVLQVIKMRSEKPMAGTSFQT